MQKIITKEDIIKEIAEEIGKPEYVVESIINYNIKYIREIVETRPEVLSIRIPFIGKLRANSIFTKRLKKTHKTPKLRDVYIEGLRGTEDYKKFRKVFRKPLLYYLNFSYRVISNSSFFKYYPTLKEIIVRSNKKNNEIYRKSKDGSSF